MSKWVEGTFYDNLDKFANSLGYENLGTAIHLSLVPWQSVGDRDSFIRAVTEKDPQGGEGNLYSGLIQKGGKK